MQQIDIFDLIPKQLPLDVPCGYISDPDLVGEQIPFTNLRNCIGKKVVKVYEGGYQTIEAGKIPAIILVKDGSVVPHAPLAQRTDQIDWNAVEMKEYKAN